MNLDLNLDNIKAIVNSGQVNWQKLLMAEIAKSKDAIPFLLGILNAERQENDQLITDLNALLSKAHLGLKEPEINKDGFMQKQISEFYKSGRINHCFANMD